MQLNICEDEGGRAGLRPGAEARLGCTAAARPPPHLPGPSFLFLLVNFLVCVSSHPFRRRW